MADSPNKTYTGPPLNLEFMRTLVRQYSELGQWTSAYFWADAAVATGKYMRKGEINEDDIWLLANTILAAGKPHRAAYVITSRELHKTHLLCLGVAMRAYIEAKDPNKALSLMEECDVSLLVPNLGNTTHNRALSNVLVIQARALLALERRGAATEVLLTALHTDCTCYEALDLLFEQYELTPKQEEELVESLRISNQVAEAETSFIRGAYNDRLHRYTAPGEYHYTDLSPLELYTESVRSETFEARVSRGRTLALRAEWATALRWLDSVDPWVSPELRAACLVELRQSAQLFVLAHTLVDQHPDTWEPWFAVGCYYYLIGKGELARRHLNKAKTLDPRQGCVWLAYGHSFVIDNEHDQAMAAYFKASQLLAGSHIPALYVGVECSHLSNVLMSQRFFVRAAVLHAGANRLARLGIELPPADSSHTEIKIGWDRIASIVQEPYVAHEAGVAAFNAGDYTGAHVLWLQTLKAAGCGDGDPGGSNRGLHPRWASTLDCLGHACRKLRRAEEAVRWHRRALALRPRRAGSLAALGLALALLGRESHAADLLHAALASDPADVVAIALLDSIINNMDYPISEGDIPQFSFPPIYISLPAGCSCTSLADPSRTCSCPCSPGQTCPCAPGSDTPATAPSTPATPGTPLRDDATNNSDMSMSFD